MRKVRIAWYGPSILTRITILASTRASIKPIDRSHGAAIFGPSKFLFLWYYSNKIVRSGWDTRTNFQASFGLTMMTGDIQEGNEILKIMDKKSKCG
jgi:hypothetical protein